MEIHRPELIERDGSASLRARVVTTRGEDWLWYSVPDSDAEALAPDTADAFIVGLLPVAMALGEDIRSEAPVSETLLFNLKHGYMQMVDANRGGLQHIAVNAEGTSEFASRGTAVATGFSGGVDSSQVVADFYFADDVPASMRLSQLMFFNVGSNGRFDDENSSRLFSQRLDHLNRAAEVIGLPLLPVDSNLSAFHSLVGFRHAATVSARNVSAALAVQARVSRYLVATGPTWSRCMWGTAPNMEYGDPFGLPLLRTERFDAMSVGGELTRWEKVERLADHEFAQKFLSPCVKGLENCSVCYKCALSELPLEILGKLDKFESVFDYAAYARARRYLIARVRLRASRGHAGLIEWAESRNYELEMPFWYLNLVRLQLWLQKLDEKTPLAVKRGRRKFLSLARRIGR